MCKLQEKKCKRWVCMWKKGLLSLLLWKMQTNITENANFTRCLRNLAGPDNVQYWGGGDLVGAKIYWGKAHLTRFWARWLGQIYNKTEHSFNVGLFLTKESLSVVCTVSVRMCVCTGLCTQTSLTTTTTAPPARKGLYARPPVTVHQSTGWVMRPTDPNEGMLRGERKVKDKRCGITSLLKWGLKESSSQPCSKWGEGWRGQAVLELLAWSPGPSLCRYPTIELQVQCGCANSSLKWL